MEKNYRKNKGKKWIFEQSRGSRGQLGIIIVTRFAFMKQEESYHFSGRRIQISRNEGGRRADFEEKTCLFVILTL